MKKERLVKTFAMGIVILFIVMSITSLVESHSIKNDSGISLITIQVEGELGLNNWYTSDVDFSFIKESEDLASIYYNTNDNNWNEYIEPFIISDDGEYALKWYAVNYEGNTSDLDGPFFFNIDQTPPEIHLEYEVTGGNPEQGWEFTWTATATDSTSGMDRVEFYQNDILQYTSNGPGPTYVWVMLYHPVPNVFFKVIGYDKAGNNDFYEIMDSSTNIASLKSSRFISDISKKTNIQKILNNVLPSELVKSENHKIIEKLPSSYTNEDVFDPAYVIVVFNRKIGGNGWIINNVTIPILFESDKINEVFYQINDEGWKVYTEPLVISDDGLYLFSYYVVDSEGFTSTPKYFNFKIDQTPPKINIIKQKIAINKVKFIANVYDNTSNIDRVKFSIYYTSEFTDYDFPYEWIWTGFLYKIVTVTAYDKAGNSASSSTSTQKSLGIQQSISQQIVQLFKNILMRYQMRYM